ncbi:MAG: GTPase HflX [Treponema sp.]|jgi:GTP-binding protein HflX|nr:GTPase HflX [Treponema sp.]
MQKLYDTLEKPKRAFLISIMENVQSGNEIERLAESLNLEAAAHEKIRIREKNPKFGMGSGKAESLAQKAAEIKADLMIFDMSLSPSQQRNWEEISGLPVIDRQELIIKIFADRASTKEAELQVRLAELTYLLPRLSHKYIDLSRQRGGRYGTKGAGETKLETDRRKLEKRIHQLEKEIENVGKQRQMQRRQRERNKMRVCAIVGYTNAGKSSLLNALTGADVQAEDKLFVTLDAVTRRLLIAPDKPVLFTDTVGFIRSLPHSLVKAFRSTLEEAALADIIIHILDASDPDIESNYETTMTVLKELGAMDIPTITLLNKIDRLPSAAEPPASAGEGAVSSVTLDEIQNRFPGSIAVSVRNKTGLDALKDRIISMYA